MYNIKSRQKSTAIYRKQCTKYNHCVRAEAFRCSISGAQIYRSGAALRDARLHVKPNEQLTSAQEDAE